MKTQHITKLVISITIGLFVGLVLVLLSCSSRKIVKPLVVTGKERSWFLRCATLPNSGDSTISDYTIVDSIGNRYFFFPSLIFPYRRHSKIVINYD